MDTNILTVQIRSLEAQLEMLRAQLKIASHSTPRRKSLAALAGILAGVTETTEQEIAASELSIKFETE